MKRVSMIASGRVQGVGFRAYVQDIACGMNLNGWVRNLADGTVEIEAEGEDEVVNRFIEHIADAKKKYIFVERVQISNKPVEENSGFLIKRD